MENTNANNNSGSQDNKKKHRPFNRYHGNRNKKHSNNNSRGKETNAAQSPAVSEATEQQNVATNNKPGDRNQQRPNRNNGPRRDNGNRRPRNEDRHQKNNNANTEALFAGMIPDEDFGYFTERKEEATPKYTFTEEELDAVLAEKEPVVDDRPKTEIIGIRFKKVGKMYYFASNGVIAKAGDSAIVETARGIEFGHVCLGNLMVPDENIIQPLRPVIRLANEEDIAHNRENNEKETEAFRICLGKIEEHGLDMKLVDAQYTFDNSKLIFYFTSVGRVDFRELVKDLASVFRIRIELRQIGIRDESKLMGGLGACGRPLCCASFLSDFVQVSIKMAKEQGLSLNSNKISGTCGRLMCCLRYEYDTYQEEIAKTPPVESIVDTPEGRATVIEMSPLAGTVKVRFLEKSDVPVKSFKRELCKIIERPAVTEEDN